MVFPIKSLNFMLLAYVNISAGTNISMRPIGGSCSTEVEHKPAN